MTLSFCVLGSGSAGNATLVTRGEPGRRRHVLIDCGLSPRQTKLRLAPLGVTIEDIEAVLFTHFDRDHFCPSWGKVIRRHGITAHIYERHQNRAIRDGIDPRHVARFRHHIELDADTQVDAVPLAHDQLGTVGFVIDHGGHRLGFATDVGRVATGLLDVMQDLHALAIESNYDPHLERTADRPVFVKRRVMSGLGHLSNQESLDAVLTIESRSRLRHVVPLHLSRQCNTPDHVRRLYSRQAPHLVDRLTIATQTQPTPPLEVTPGPKPTPAPPRAAQLALF